MIGSDIVVGWVTNGQVHVSDRHGTTENAFPPEDPVQNVEAVTGSECDGWTLFKFTRQLAACESAYDREITSSTMRLIWAYGDEDPTGNEFTSADYHGTTNRGSQSMYFLQSADTPSGDLPSGPEYKSFEILAEDFLIPPVETYYNCRLYKLPELSEKHHIVKVEPVIQKGNEVNVHHILIYQCTDVPENSTELGKDEHCYSSNMAHFQTCTETIAAWAIGGGAFAYPDNTGYSIGGEGDSSYIQMEIHYDNPDKAVGKRDNSGIRFIYSSSLRKHDVGVFAVGINVDRMTHLIPPGAESFLNSGYCAGSCLENTMQDANVNNISVFAVMLHAHTTGRKLKLRHIRDSLELPYISYDDSYDFNYQESRYLHPPVEIRPKDKLRLDCVYNTVGRTELVEGGLETTNEMCLAYLFYYPKINISQCATSPGFVDLIYGIGIKYERNPNATSTRDFAVVDPGFLEGKTLYAVLSDPETSRIDINRMSEIQLTVKQTQVCVRKDRGTPATEILYPPIIREEYVPRNASCIQPKKVLSQSHKVIECPEVYDEPVTTTTATIDVSGTAIFEVFGDDDEEEIQVDPSAGSINLPLPCLLVNAILLYQTVMLYFCICD